MLFNTKMPSKRRFTVFLSFLLAAFSGFYFSACKKDNFLVEQSTQSISELHHLNQTITIEEAKIWYKKTLSDEESITVFSADSAVLLKAEPQWEDSKSGFSNN